MVQGLPRGPRALCAVPGTCSGVPCADSCAFCDSRIDTWLWELHLPLPLYSEGRVLGEPVAAYV